MIKTQDPKYYINGNGEICNTATKVPIPSDEPIFILRAKDELAAQTIAYYQTMVCTEQHKDSVKDRITDFNTFRLKNHILMKAPD